MSTTTHKRATIESVLSQVETSGEIAARTGYAGPTVANFPKNYPADHANPYPDPVGRKGNASLYMTVEVDAWLARFEQTTVENATDEISEPTPA